MALATQLSALPTNKLVAGTVSATLIAGAWTDFWGDVWPTLATDNIGMLAAVAISLAIGYFVPDRVNVEK